METNYNNQKAKAKGVIISAGYGSRFLPATKTIAKELFPIVNRPAIDFIVQEMIDAGIEDILIITSRRKKSLDDYFDREIELENAFANDIKKKDLIAPPKANISFIRQMEMKGTGHALSLCRSFVHNSPFVVAYPDDIVFSDISLSRQLINTYNQTGKSVLAVKNMPDEDVSRYGVISPLEQISNSIYTINSMVEKPTKGTEPSTMVSIGRYLFTPEIFDIIDRQMPSMITGEYYQTDIINALASIDRICALDFDGIRYDTGEPVGYIKTIIDYALSQDHLRDELLPYITSLVQKHQKYQVSPVNITNKTFV